MIAMDTPTQHDLDVLKIVLPLGAFIVSAGLAFLSGRIFGVSRKDAVFPLFIIFHSIVVTAFTCVTAVYAHNLHNLHILPSGLIR